MYIGRKGPKLNREKKRRCKKEFCTKRAMIDRDYCSQDCAPFGRWADNDFQVNESRKRMQFLEEKYKDFDDNGILRVKCPKL